MAFHYNKPQDIIIIENRKSISFLYNIPATQSIYFTEPLHINFTFRILGIRLDQRQPPLIVPGASIAFSNHLGLDYK